MTDFDLSALISPTLLVIDFIIRIVALIIIPRNRKPTAAMAWLLAVFFIPYVGLLFFLLIGSSKLPKSRRLKQEQINTFILDSTEGMDLVLREHPWPKWLESVVRLNRTLGAMPLVGANSATLIGDYNQSIAAMTADVNRAERFVHCEFYIMSYDDVTADFFEALDNAGKRGVVVRVLLDHVASMRSPRHKETVAKLNEIHVQWQFMLPVQPFKGKYQRPDLRNHRKLLVIDGHIGYMGSQNMIDRSYNIPKNIKRGLKWQDLMARLHGPIVSGVNAIFITDWFSETNELLSREIEPIRADVMDNPNAPLDCQVVPSGPGFEGENNLRLFLALLYNAEERIIITSPYFVPDESMMYAITTATQRGIEVQLFVSEIGDQALVFHAQRSYYEALLLAGVQIWMYKAPFILHSKHFTIDDDVAVIGSSNMDIRSFSLNMEVSLMVRGRSFVTDMREIEAGYRAVSRELTLEEWLKRPLRSSVLDNLARLTSGLQ